MDATASCTCSQDATDEKMMAQLDAVISDYRTKPGNLIPILQIAQNIFGYLPLPVLHKIAKDLDKPYSEVAGVVGFYSFFSTKPRGRNVIRICLGTACYVRGGLQVLEAVKKEIGIDVGDTTPDREFSLEVARCFGACGLAPTLSINEEVHKRVRPVKIPDIIKSYRKKAKGAA